MRTQYDNDHVWKDRNPLYDAAVIRQAIQDRFQIPDPAEMAGILVVKDPTDIDSVVAEIARRTAEPESGMVSGSELPTTNRAFGAASQVLPD
jgi:hypothetical protein